MSTEVKIPALGESISSGIIATWHVADGDYVEEGQTLFDLETDKITSEGTADASGTIQLKAEEGDEVEIGAVVAVIDESAAKPAGQKDPAAPSDRDDDSSEQQTEEAPASETKEQDKDASTSASGDTGPYPHSVRRIAAESGVDPAQIKGSGKGGRVTKANMQEAAKAAAKSSQAESPPTSPAPSETATSESQRGQVQRRRMSPLRKTISRRLVEAQQSTAMLTTFNEVDMSAVMTLRKRLQPDFTERHGIKLGFMSFFTKAAVSALQVVPALRDRIDGEEILSPQDTDIGIAVSTPRGLMVPVVRDCDRKSFAEIEQSISEYAGRARQNKITMEDLEGGVFTITNGGIFGSMLSTPILNTPQSGILGMHTIQERPVVVEGEIVARPMMYLALSYDHRLVDGREAVTFLVAIKKAIEDPSRLLFEL